MPESVKNYIKNHKTNDLSAYYRQNGEQYDPNKHYRNRGLYYSHAGCTIVQTGSFGMLDSIASITPKLNNKIFSIQIEEQEEMKPGERTFNDAYQLLYKIKHPVVLAVVATLDFLDKALEDNFNIDLNLIVTSEISGSLKGTINTAEGSNFTERLMKDEDDTPCKFGGKLEISLKGKIDGKTTTMVFGFIKRTVYAGLEGVATTGISVECVTKANESSIYVEPEIKFEGFILTAKFDAGTVDPPKDETDLSEADGLHYTADGRIVVLDPYEWETGWKFPIISLK